MERAKPMTRLEACVHLGRHTVGESCTAAGAAERSDLARAAVGVRAAARSAHRAFGGSELGAARKASAARASSPRGALAFLAPSPYGT